MEFPFLEPAREMCSHLHAGLRGAEGDELDHGVAEFATVGRRRCPLTFNLANGRVSI
jgi:hypothetical protein